VPVRKRHRIRAVPQVRETWNGIRKRPGAGVHALVICPTARYHLIIACGVRGPAMTAVRGQVVELGESAAVPVDDQGMAFLLCPCQKGDLNFALPPPSSSCTLAAHCVDLAVVVR